MKLGNSIKAVRMNRNLTQSQLAGLCKISQTALSQIESNKKNPGNKTIQKICDGLHIPAAVLYIMGLDESDVPEKRKEIFTLLYPSIKNLALEIAGKE